VSGTGGSVQERWGLVVHCIQGRTQTTWQHARNSGGRGVRGTAEPPREHFWCIAGGAGATGSAPERVKQARGWRPVAPATAVPQTTSSQRISALHTGHVCERSSHSYRHGRWKWWPQLVTTLGLSSVGGEAGCTGCGIQQDTHRPLVPASVRKVSPLCPQPWLHCIAPV
jgi:hypothetical protein